ncbi:hypothetical protein GCM10010124_02580 [Pilimelia terevasa]|uniref:Uncharacterized protein n=1 Tax=Pilimelia terevasa TaxID=53372 RepID=A0A8J3FEB5_9ACTN|nr:hypothetical protein [Pilimelia terevasa]GGK13503.1 hypothetical protein GCM10010124_02580 [Pilimelia terevasa]
MLEPDELTLKIARHLEIDFQYVKRFESWDSAGIAQARAAGRAAGRLLGRKVLTVQSEPDEEGRVNVVVVVREVDGEDRQRMEERSRLILEHLWQDPPD